MQPTTNKPLGKLVGAPRIRRRVFYVGGIAPECSVEDLQQFCEDQCPLIDCRLMPSRRTGTQSAYVTVSKLRKPWQTNSDQSPGQKTSMRATGHSKRTLNHLSAMAPQNTHCNLNPEAPPLIPNPNPNHNTREMQGIVGQASDFVEVISTSPPTHHDPPRHHKSDQLRVSQLNCRSFSVIS